MKKLILMSFISAFTISCSSGNDDKNNEEISQGNKLSLVISDEYYPTSSIPHQENNSELDSIVNTYSVTKPVFPKKDLSVYFICKVPTEQYKVGDIVKSFNLEVGKNDLTDLPRMKYDVVVTNYKKYTKDQYGNEVEDLEWFKYSDGIENLPNLSQKIYLFTRAVADYTTETVAEIKIQNTYSLIKHLKFVIDVDVKYTYPNDDFDEIPIIDVKYTEIKIDEPIARVDFGGETSQMNMFDDNSDYYYIYARRTANIKITNGNQTKTYYFEKYSPNIVHAFLTFRNVEYDSYLSYRKDYSFIDNSLK